MIWTRYYQIKGQLNNQLLFCACMCDTRTYVNRCAHKMNAEYWCHRCANDRHVMKCGPIASNFCIKRHSMHDQSIDRTTSTATRTHICILRDCVDRFSHLRVLVWLQYNGKWLRWLNGQTIWPNRMMIQSVNYKIHTTLPIVSTIIDVEQYNILTESIE